MYRWPELAVQVHLNIHIFAFKATNIKYFFLQISQDDPFHFENNVYEHYEQL